MPNVPVDLFPYVVKYDELLQPCTDSLSLKMPLQFRVPERPPKTCNV